MNMSIFITAAMIIEGILVLAGITMLIRSSVREREQNRRLSELHQLYQMESLRFWQDSKRFWRDSERFWAESDRRRADHDLMMHMILERTDRGNSGTAET